MPHHTYVHTDTTPGVLVATITWPSLSEHECGVVLNDILADAPVGRWRIVLDLSKVTFFSSSGIGVIVRLHRECAEHKGRIAVCGLNPELLSVLKITRMDKLFPFLPDRAAAIKAVS